MLGTIALSLGVAVGGLIAAFGGYLVWGSNEPDFPTYQAEQTYYGCMGDVLGVPCIVIGLALLGLCGWGLIG